METYICMKTCTQIFSAAIIPKARSWKQSKCLALDEQVGKTWRVHKWTIIYLYKKKGEALTQAAVWISLENTMLSERN
jgi:hypothetical protein